MDFDKQRPHLRRPQAWTGAGFPETLIDDWVLPTNSLRLHFESAIRGESIEPTHVGRICTLPSVRQAFERRALPVALQRKPRSCLHRGESLTPARLPRSRVN